MWILSIVYHTGAVRTSLPNRANPAKQRLYKIVVTFVTYKAVLIYYMNFTHKEIFG